MVVSIMEDYDKCWKWGGGDVILYNNGQRNPTGDEIGEDAGM